MNIRGIKSKLESLKEIIDQKQPDIVGMVETHLQEDEEIQLEGYHILMKDKNGEGGGLLLGIRSFFPYIEEDVEIAKSKHLEGLCVLIGSKTKVRVSIFYAPQGEKINKREMKELYKTIKEHIEIGQEKGCKLLIMGDFIAKVGGKVKYGDKEANKGGKELVKICEEVIWK